MRLKLLLCMVVVNFAVPSGILLDRVQGVSKLSLCLRGGLDFYPSSSWEDEYKHLHPDRFNKSDEVYPDLKKMFNGTLRLMEEALKNERQHKEAWRRFSLSDLEVDHDEYEPDNLDPFDMDKVYVGPNKAKDIELLKHMKMHRWLHDRKFNDRMGRALHDEVMKTKHFNFRCMSAVEIYHFQGRKLMEAAKFGDLDEITRLIESGVSVNHQNIFHDSPLHWAAVQGRHKAVTLLIRYGANVNLQTERGRTPLHNAVAISDCRIVYDLLRAGANPHLQDASFFNPLDLAVHIKEHDHENAVIENQKVIEMLMEANGARSRVSSPTRSNVTEGKVYDIFSPFHEVKDEGDPIVVYEENLTESRWESFCSEAEKGFPQEVREEAQRYIDEAEAFTGSGKRRDKVARNKQEKKVEKVERKEAAQSPSAGPEEEIGGQQGFLLLQLCGGIWS
ncbi:hypothetical protein GUITHDRAFT_102011 [Guillardia theta CCMP2712]|uniref:Uncharacterized protein n=1 Tax=Guillardia theta (strain CCMP2712) TaxID=905079 RepID=L1JVI0_GUITC|nr:hypothetical protein GUITHDRAFT_102011 [Guillardia theta CCMP2712]EKX52108.1 hypothetical protein GUITHDRAFT_102011 [Guillardia theta CCMP2712]|eukprot:XP_005839088.1 hypothetical protein GUITHDRAFT_102011 [Guillardia theta CCMP2712]